MESTIAGCEPVRHCRQTWVVEPPDRPTSRARHGPSRPGVPERPPALDRACSQTPPAARPLPGFPVSQRPRVAPPCSPPPTRQKVVHFVARTGAALAFSRPLPRHTRRRPRAVPVATLGGRRGRGRPLRGGARRCQRRRRQCRWRRCQRRQLRRQLQRRRARRRPGLGRTSGGGSHVACCRGSESRLGGTR